MGLAGKFVFFDGPDFCQYGEVVDQVGEYFILIKWHRPNGRQPSPTDEQLFLVDVAELTVMPGEDTTWKFFATAEQLEAYKVHADVRPIEEVRPAAEVIDLRGRS